ncbi:putative intracellular protease/amidase [Caulobacter sp. BE264]|uniref:type 1 glutamine amidotransferase family protein n=1 Tax=Caulobacter sp. BE264 TaxID=2817724 RepID=UPI00285DF8FC|nr:type 1 glutamine amidotransferase family protein [Caulobacter sp. BE264]MDR7229944.1 putative intracellular protease/amidase [Caulobacter sp. BE264]
MTVAVAFLQPGWADWEAGAVLALLREHLKVQIEIATPTGDPETSIGGVLAAADYRFDDPVLSDADVFLLIGSDAWSEGENPAISALIRQALADGKPVAGICAGTTALARAGLFAGRKHTSNGKDWLESVVPGYAGAEHYVDTPKAVTDGKLVSASGLAPVTFAAAVARLIAPEQEALIAGYEAMFAREFAAT